MERDETLEGGTPPTPQGFAVGAQVAGRYKITRKLGAGAMGEVFAAEDLIINATVALKVLRPELQGNAAAIARVRREIALARKVTDVHVCRVHDVGEHDGRSFITMELLDGTSLADHVAAKGPLPLPEVERIARDLIAGLAALHREGIVHRDFKSANVMLVGERAVITDFGLARSAHGDDVALTAEAAVLGTPAYMAPEQVQGKPATAASDIYALGIVLFELLTGKRPFKGDSALAVASARLTDDPPPPSSLRSDLPARWNAIVLRCLDREPAARPQLDDILDDAPARSLGMPARWRGAVVGVGFGVALLGIAAVAVLATRNRDADPDRPVLRERRLTAFEGRSTVSSIAMSRDGKRIAYQAGALWLYDLDRDAPARATVDPARLPTLRALDFFPDGRLLVRTREGDDLALAALELGSGRFERLPMAARHAVLSPTGDRIAYFSDDGIAISTVAGTERRLMATPEFGGYQLAWSPDGAWIAVLLNGTQRNELAIVAADGSSSTRDIPGPFAHTAGVAWAASDVLYFTRLKNPRDSELCRVRVVNGVWDREPPRCIWTFENAFIDWMRLGAGRLVFVKNSFATSVETIPVDATGKLGARAPLPAQQGGNQTWGFTADGRVMFATSGTADLSRVGIQRPSDPEPRLLAGTTFDDFAIDDGESVVFTRSSPSGCTLVRATGDRQQTIVSEPAARVCPYVRCGRAPNRRCALIRMVGPNYVVRMFDLATAREVGPERRRPHSGNVTVDLSPTGATLAWSIEGSSEAAIALLDIDTGDYRELRPQGSLAPHDVSWWSQDEWLIAGTDRARGDQVLVRMRADGSYDELARDATGGTKFHNPFVSHDGKTIVLAVEYSRADAFALEGL